MYTFLLTFHVILSVFLVLIIMMQPGKGADISSAFGGGSASQLFGASGPGNFLTRGTGVIAGLFMVTSILLALMSTEGSSGFDNLENLQEEGEAGGGFGNATPAPENALPPLDALPPMDAPPGDAAPEVVPPADAPPSAPVDAPAGTPGAPPG
jgi:preprotein translocase subunit SecG